MKPLIRALLWGTAVIGGAGVLSSNAVGIPERPRSVPAPLTLISQNTTWVRAGDNLQRALDRAEPGDTLILEAGAAFVGPFTLPRKRGAGWVAVLSAADSALPTRVQPSDAHLMPKLLATRGPVIRTAPGAHHWILAGLEISPAPNLFLHNVVELGSGRSIEDVPNHIIIDRCYIHGDRARGARRGIALNAAHAAVLGSYVSDFKDVGADSQAIAGWGGQGPLLIDNNTLEGAGENLMFGGADPPAESHIPSDIVVRRNILRKPLTWKPDAPGFEGIPWTVKNILELKNARRVLIEDNLLENNWPDAQNGFAVLFTPRNQEGTAPWSVVQDVTFVGNVVRSTANAINILGRDDSSSRGSAQTRRILIRQNLFLNVGSPQFGGGGTLVQILEGTADIRVEKNTAAHAHNIVTADGAPHTGFVFRDNIVFHNTYGVFGSGTAPGNPTLEHYFPSADFQGNVIIGGQATRYPPGNYFPATPVNVGFVDLGRGQLGLATTSPYLHRGADVAARLQLAQALSGQP